MRKKHAIIILTLALVIAVIVMVVVFLKQDIHQGNSVQGNGQEVDVSDEQLPYDSEETEETEMIPEADSVQTEDETISSANQKDNAESTETNTENSELSDKDESTEDEVQEDKTESTEPIELPFVPYDE